MDDDYDEDEYAPLDGYDDSKAEESLIAAPQGGPDLFADQAEPGLFDLPEEPEPEPVPTQDGPDLFGTMPDTSRAKVVAAAIRPTRGEEPADTEDSTETSTQDSDASAEETAPDASREETSPDPTAAAPEPPATPQQERATPTPDRRPATADAETQASPAPDIAAADVPAAPLALYRRYRPDTFTDVIGQEHVTDPLQRALVNNRVNHAYLFSGPRGCGKTTSARILARCLNCVQGPTPTPCGECQSCRDLARGGPGSIDVIEIDAASHGGVDDARDLRERAFFAPVSSRYKIYIVDEAHMVTTAGFNALLKLVEEPPPHVKFIFATTEPEKVIGTIRSRTHHYPFRLVPPRVLTDYLGRLCESEGVRVDPAVLPLVVRAGAGSVRDSLSVLDQLLGAADDDGVGYAAAAALLGYTPDALLDDIIDAFAAGDAAAVFSTIDKVIEVGQDPRRFAEDLLRRLRDLIIVAAVPTAASTGLIDVAADQADRLATQVSGMGRGELTRAAEVLASGLTEMRGTTAPRLHLELMCARVLLPGADVDGRGLHARLDRLERRVGMIGDPQPPAQWSDVSGTKPHDSEPQDPGATPHHDSRPERPVAAEASASSETSSESRQKDVAPTASLSPEGHQSSRPPEQQRRAGQPAGQRPAGQPPTGQRPGGAPAMEPSELRSHADEAHPPRQAVSPETSPSTATDKVHTLNAVELRRIWPAILDRVKDRRRYTWMMLREHAQVLDLTDGRLTLGFANPGARDSFGARGSTDDLREVLLAEIGVELHIVSVLSDSPPDTAPSQRPAGSSPTSVAATNPDPAPPPPPEPQISDDDEELVDENLTVYELLASELGAEVIHEEPTD